MGGEIMGTTTLPATTERFALEPPLDYVVLYNRKAL